MTTTIQKEKSLETQTMYKTVKVDGLDNSPILRDCRKSSVPWLWVGVAATVKQLVIISLALRFDL